MPADAQSLTPPDAATRSPNGQQAADAAAAAAAAPKRGSIFEDVGLDEPNTEGTTTWPDTWRDDMARGLEDQKAAEALKRYQSPAEVAKALIAAQQRIRSGEYKRVVPPPEGADEATIKAWREEQGLPATPDDYKIPAIAGVDFDNLDDTTKANLSEFKKAFFDGNVPQAAADKVASTLVAVAQRQMEQQATADASNMERLDDDLRATWGRDYKANLKMTHAWMSQQFGEQTDEVLLARMPNGQRLVDNPAFLKSMAAAARGSGSDVFFDEGSSHATSLEGRRAEIEKIMNTDFMRYQRENLGDEYSKILSEMEQRGKL